MHPIERLRFLARSPGLDPDLLVPEVAEGLAALGSDRAGMVMAGHRMVQRHWMCGPIWWVCGRILTATDPSREAWRLIDAFDADPTREHVHELLDDAIGSDTAHLPVIIGAMAGGPSGFVVEVPNRAQSKLADARRDQRQVWVVAGIGRILPEAIWDRVAARFNETTGRPLDGRPDNAELVSLEFVDVVIGADGPMSGPDAVRRSDVVIAPELLRR